MTATGVIAVTAAYPVAPVNQGPPRWVREFPGEPWQVGRARQFVARVLAGCPARETLLTCVSELAANAIEHTATGAGGVFTVEVFRPRAGVALVAVTDGGCGGEPTVRQAGDLAEGGRGLALVAALSSRWGYCAPGQGRAAGQGWTVWAEATWPVPVEQLSQPVSIEPLSQRVRVGRLSQPVSIEQLSRPVCVEQPSRSVSIESLSQPVRVGQLSRSVSIEPLSQPVPIERLSQI